MDERLKVMLGEPFAQESMDFYGGYFSIVRFRRDYWGDYHVLLVRNGKSSNDNWRVKFPTKAPSEDGG